MKMLAETSHLHTLDIAGTYKSGLLYAAAEPLPLANSAQYILLAPCLFTRELMSMFSLLQDGHEKDYFIGS